MDRLGTPKDFWPVAVIALATTVSVAGLSIYQIKEDALHGNVNVSDCSGHTNGTSFTPTFPEPSISGKGSLNIAFDSNWTPIGVIGVFGEAAFEKEGLKPSPSV